MTNFELRTRPVLQEYFGKYGGFFVPDPFTPALDDLATSLKQVFTDNEFAKHFQALIETLEVQPVTMVRKGQVGEAIVYTTLSQASEMIIAGYAALGKITGKILVAGVRSHSHACQLAAASKALGLKCHLWLSTTLGANRDLVNELERANVQVNTEQCRTLFDIPEMYAFQKYISDPENNLWVPLETNVGPYPFPALTASFAAFYGDRLFQAVAEQSNEKIRAILAPGYPGTTAVGILRAMPKQKVRLITYEARVDHEDEECFCGAYTRVARVGRAENVLSPELLYAWEENQVERCQVPYIESVVEMLNLSGKVIVVEAV